MSATVLKHMPRDFQPFVRDHKRSYSQQPSAKGVYLFPKFCPGGSSPKSTVKTAREKHRSVTAEDAAQAVVDVEKAMRSHASKQAPNAKSIAPSSVTRRNKNLGWFLDDDIFEKKGNQMKNESMIAKGTEEKKKRKGSKRSSKKSSDAVSEGSVASEDCSEELGKQANADNTSKDDYWFYDLATDGYYYEQGGAKGWRRRMPNSVVQQKKEQQEAESKLNNVKTAILNNQQQQVQAAAARAALLQSALFNPQPYKYYDPSSDGYYYEMASVDGWKKRQTPQQGSVSRAPSTQSSRASPPTTSYGAALAKGQMPRNCIIDESSASSSVSEDPVSSQDPFGLESGFQLADNFRLLRPDSLNLESRDQILPSFNADKFIQDLSFSGIDSNKMWFGSRTPHESSLSWNIHDKLSAPDSEDITMGNLLKGLENIWAAPTPVDKV